MKKVIVCLLIISLFYVFISEALADKLMIPDDAIRIRVIPNSNSAFDQNVKLKVRDELEITLYDLLKDASSSLEAEKIINDNLELISRDVDKVLDSFDYKDGFSASYGYNYFPSKEYKGTVYAEGYYKSLLVTIGKGEGDNWWCVLYPPLCLIEDDNSSSVNYKSFVSEILKKYL